MEWKPPCCTVGVEWVTTYTVITSDRTYMQMHIFIEITFLKYNKLIVLDLDNSY